MLVKKELTAVPYCPAPVMKIEKKKDLCGRDNNCGAAATVVKLPKSGKVLVVDIYELPADEPKVRFFTDRKNYATLDMKNGIFTKAMPGNEYLGNKREYYSSPCSICCEKDYQTVVDYLKAKSWREEIVATVDAYIQNKRGDQATRAYNNKIKKREDLFKLLKPYGKSHNRFCEKKVFGDTFLFFGKLEKGGREVICGNCGAVSMTKDRLKHKERGKCAACGKSAVYWAKNYEPSIRQKQKLCVAQKHDEQLIMKWSTVTRTYKGQKPVYSYEDFFRTFYMVHNGKPVIYHYSLTCNYGGWDWRRKDYHCTERTFVFADNLNRVFGEKYYNVDLKKEMGKCEHPVNFAGILDRLQDTPEAEYLVKLGMLTLASESNYIQLTGQRGFDSLGISKQYLQMYKKLDVSLHEHEIIVKSKTFVKAETVEKYRALSGVTYYSEIRDKFIENYSLEKYVNYFYKQLKKNGLKITDNLMFYKDYTETIKLLRRPMTDKATLFPDDLKKAHDETARDYKVKESEYLNKSIKKRIREVNAAWGYRNNELMMIAPENAKEFVDEGTANGNCVAGYAKRHASGETTIVFIRKANEPKTPYFTAEIDKHGIIVQCRRKGNLGKTPDVTAFLAEWEREIK